MARHMILDENQGSRTFSAAETLRALAIEAADMGTWDIDFATKVTFWSEQTRSLFGLPKALPLTQEDLFNCVHAEDRSRVEFNFMQALDPGVRAPHDVEFRIVKREDGGIRWIAAKGKAYFDAEGRAVRCVGTYVDITKRRESERYQACLLELGDRMRALNSTADIVGVAAEVLGRALCCARAGYAVIRGDHTYVEADWTDGEAVSTPGPRPFAALGVAFCAPLQAGVHHAIHDVTVDPLTQHNKEAFRRVRIGALINMPLMENGVLCAIAYAQHTTPHRWTEQEIQLVKSVADHTWEARGRAVAIQALRKVNSSLEEEISLRTAQRDRMWRLSSDVLVFADLQGNIESVNPAWNRIFGWTELELSSRNLLDLSHPEDRASLKATLENVNTSHSMSSFESRCRCRDGTYRRISWRAVPDGNSIQAAGRDITSEFEQTEALRVTEEALRQAQKMEAVGQLTGGIAHDFNNLLQGITGSLDLVQKRMAAGRLNDSIKFLAAAKDSAKRAAALTHRLLAFSRRQPLDPQPVEANALIVSMKDLMRQTMGELIQIRLSLSPALWPTLCDPNQLENAILNLAINARDAMHDGGTLLLETTNVHSDARAEGPSAVPGEWICVTMTDTGVGMPSSVRERAFEPFYTTKPIGQGTGLGLSMIYGFMKQSGGHVRLDSKVAIGTTVTLYFPRYHGPIIAAKRSAEMPIATPLATPATVLVVEDEELVRNLVIEVLGELGVDALGAANGIEGLELLQSARRIDLLITDIGLPGLNGRLMAEAACQRRPELKVLMMTGYAESVITNSEILPPNMEMLAKPFSIDLLTQRLRQMLS